MAKKVVALRLTLGGAPSSWHTVGEFPGLYHPLIAVPITIVGVAEETAHALHNDDGCPVEVVMLGDEDAAANTDAYYAAVGDSRRGVTEAARLETAGAEADRLVNELVVTEGTGN